MSDSILAAPKPSHHSVNHVFKIPGFLVFREKVLDHEDHVWQVLGYKDSGKAVVKSGFAAVQVSTAVGISYVF